MKPEVYAALLDLNRAFYTRFAGDFARTRQSWPPGYDLILPHLAGAANVLDLGCGNGRFLAYLAGQGWRGHYTGLDGSAGLLAEAQQMAAGLDGVTARFVQGDLLNAAWPAAAGSPADAIVCLAVLHHVPTAASRRRILAEAAMLLAPGGRLIVSTWQFMTSERLRRRMLPWETVGLSADDVEAGDYLVTWGAGAAGHRYCAFIDEAELHQLAADAGLQVVATYHADGYEGNLNLYGVYVTAR